MRYSGWARSLSLAAAWWLQMGLLGGGVPTSWQFFAQVGDGRRLRTVFLSMNPNDFPCHVTVTLNRANGQEWPLGRNEFLGARIGVNLPAGGSI